ncbi:MAG: ATP-dependent helicase/nuclease subunit B [Porticoccaceae bacterium]|jgi:ATP-dependent helicase/nuclease subunit B
MKSFLSSVIEDVIEKNKAPIHDVVFILPSQRSCVFLKNELISKLENTSFLPKITSIEKYIQEIAGLKTIDSIQLLFRLYTVYIENTDKKKLDSFEVFYQWASIVLQDFNEVDSNLLDSKDLFTYLRDINRLKNWSPNTKLTKNYFSFFEKLNLYYDAFYKYLLSENIGYQGLIYREAESNIQHYIKSVKNKQLVFVGFNALNNAEERIFQELLENGLATIYWDVDQQYLTPTNEIGVFLRKYKEKWPYYKKNPFLTVNTYSKRNNINIIGTSKNVSQLKYVGKLLEQEVNHNNTALILADENLLPLTLNSLPSSIDKVNITMGFPMKEMPLAFLFNSIFEMYLNQEKMGVSEKHLFYYKDLIRLFNDSYFKKLSNNLSTQISIDIGKSNRIFLSKEQLFSKYSEVNVINRFDFLFHKNNTTVKNILHNCIQIIECFKEEVDGIEKEYVYRFYTIFQQLITLNQEFNHIKNVKTLYMVFIQLTKNEKLSFQGEPLEGLQLMGMLESRVIDFENVIITSVNEGVLPASKSENSFIPLDVKKHFGLPTYQEKDAIFSYHFNRLLHRAENVYLLYNTENDAFGNGEKSRFITQLEINRDNLNHRLISTNVPVISDDPKTIYKSDVLMEDLKLLAEKGLSPSSISTYIYNPIDFYYQKILKIKEVEEVEETVAVNTMGTVIHDTLEDLYKPYIGLVLTETSILSMLKYSNEIVQKSFEKQYKNGDISKGKNKLIFEVSKKYVNRFLKQELRDINSGKQIKILGLEQKISTNILIDSVNFPIKINGIIDRIDQVDGVLRIVDYKTGMVSAADLKISNFTIIKEDYKHTKALQVLLYAYLYCQESNVDYSQPMESGIISFKNLNSGFLKVNFAEGRAKDTQVTKDKIDEFIVEIKNILTEIFNSEIPFEENMDKAF